ncbi:MAG: protoporphyrinogen oxidase HemJ [Alphaproteobacteria bacterium]|nr:protoporphyrinogen oxidase HemJ [Alphaproteobacteria bacterium]
MYLTFKALHIISVVCWFAGLFYLPRIFVYYTERAKTEETKQVLQTMSFKLLKYITTPAAVATWVFGLILLIQNPYLFEEGWIHAKLTCVILLTVYHAYLIKYNHDVQLDAVKKSGKYFRIFNEIPTIILIIVVFLAVLKPF